ncbi:MAG: SDR family oxidoreductase [Deltaproteobacteria bacterium]|nr:SDR family oxidoreductase [Deltaproteobacteria bacterium]
MAATGPFARNYGPWALVTGASSGIGEHFARLLAAEGLDLVIVARREERLEALASELRALHGVAVEAQTLDLARADSAETLLAVCAGRDIGLVVSNAGIGLKGAHADQSPEELAEMLAVNCRAPLLIANAFAPRLAERGRGGLLLVGSIEAYVGFPYSAAYSASKAFVRGFGEALWAELRGCGVDVLVLAPGPTDTEILSRSGFEPEDMTGLMSPEEVARQALAHLGRGPSFVPGAVNRVLTTALSLLPRRLAVTLAGKGMRAALEKVRTRG